MQQSIQPHKERFTAIPPKFIALQLLIGSPVCLASVAPCWLAFFLPPRRRRTVPRTRLTNEPLTRSDLRNKQRTKPFELVPRHARAVMTCGRVTGHEWGWVVLVKTAFARATPAGGEKESDSFDRGHTRNGGVSIVAVCIYIRRFWLKIQQGREK
jgi:hypothetical protein